MSKTPTEELEVVTMRLPSPLLDRARKDSVERDVLSRIRSGLPWRSSSSTTSRVRWRRQ